MLDLIDMLNCFDSISIIIIGVKFWGEEFQKANGLAAKQTQKNNRFFAGSFFANQQSVAISLGPLVFFALRFFFQKKN